MPGRVLLTDNQFIVSKPGIEVVGLTNQGQMTFSSDFLTLEPFQTGTAALDNNQTNTVINFTNRGFIPLLVLMVQVGSNWHNNFCCVNLSPAQGRGVYYLINNSSLTIRARNANENVSIRYYLFSQA